jgi:RimJ/RimL family protein N-acetyltransferase
MIFETDRLRVRPYTAEEFEYFFQLSSDVDVMRYIRPVQDREQSLEFFRKILADYESLPGLGRWIMHTRSDSRFVGSFAVIPVENSLDIQIGYSLSKSNWGLGYASEAVKGALRYVFDSLKLEKVVGITEVANIASQKVLLKNGFVFDHVFLENGKKLYLYKLKKEEAV